MLSEITPPLLSSTQAELGVERLTACDVALGVRTLCDVMSVALHLQLAKVLRKDLDSNSPASLHRALMGAASSVPNKGFMSAASPQKLHHCMKEDLV